MKKNHLLLVTIFFLIACNNNPKESIKISIIGENTANLKAMMQLEKDYEKKNKGVDLDFKPNTFDSTFIKTEIDYQKGTRKYDVSMQYHSSLASFMNNKYVWTLDEILNDIPKSKLDFENDLFLNAWKEVGFYKDQNNSDLIKVGYPFATNTMLLMYNKELFENKKQQKAFLSKYEKDLKVPETWEDLIEVADFFTQKEKKLKGICLEGAKGGWLYYEFMNFLFGNGGKVMDKKFGWDSNLNTPITINSPEGLNALKLYKSLKPFNSGDFINVEQFQQMRIMKEGKTALAIVWSDIIYNAIKTDAGFDNRFAFSTIPGDKSMIAGGIFFINRESSKVKETKNYIIDLMQPQHQVFLAKKGLSSALKKVYEDKEVIAIPYSKALKNSLERGVYMVEAGPDANIIIEVITTYVQMVWSDKISPEAALNEIQLNIEKEREKLK